jgi:hypothetical protein
MKDGRGAERVSYGVRFEQMRRRILQRDGGSDLVSRGTTRDNIVSNLDMKWVGCRASRPLGNHASGEAYGGDPLELLNALSGSRRR